MLAAFSEQMQDLLSPHEYSLETQKVSQRNNCFGLLQKRDWNGETRRGEKRKGTEKQLTITLSDTFFISDHSCCSPFLCRWKLSKLWL